MARVDLLALSADDLTALSNRGIVKRAQQEAESGQLTCELLEAADGNITAGWSDGIECRLPAHAALAGATCSCPATSLCRHIVRTIFAYQRRNATGGTSPPPGSKPPLPSSAPEESVPAAGIRKEEAQAPTQQAQSEEPAAQPPPSPPAPRGAPWDPGAIADAELGRIFPPTALAQAKRLAEEGQVLELVRAAKPTARNHTLGFHLRFLVPGDARYTYCDCSEPAPCSHVPLAVWAFRMLPPDQAAGTVSTRSTPHPVPLALLDDVEETLGELAYIGAAAAPSSLMDRLRRMDGRCRAEGLIWPAEILAEIVQQQDAYVRRDARFAAILLAELLAEICIRMDAIRTDTGAAPQLFVRGAKSDRLTAIGAARLVGLGCDAEIRRGGARLCSYLQDSDSGSIVVVRRDYSDPATPQEQAPMLWQLAQSPVFKGASLASLGTGQALVKGGKRSPNHEFLFGRAAVNVNPQTYQWESLRPPALAESFREIASRLNALPPPSLRPRRLGEDLHICPLAAIEKPRFLPEEQAIIATLRDPEGGAATLWHPYTSRSAPGSEALLQRLLLAERTASIRFVAGHARLRGGELRIEPVSLVLEEGHRSLLQPWVERPIAPTDADGASSVQTTWDGGSRAPAPLDFCWSHLMEDAGALLLTGLMRADMETSRRWSENLLQAEALGFNRLAAPLAALHGGLASKQETLNWDWRPTFQALTEIVAAALLIQTA